jgi:hypothetical protein
VVTILVAAAVALSCLSALAAATITRHVMLRRYDLHSYARQRVAAAAANVSELADAATEDHLARLHEERRADTAELNMADVAAKLTDLHARVGRRRRLRIVHVTSGPRHLRRSAVPLYGAERMAQPA